MEQNNMFVPEWNNPTSGDRNEVVFEKKNKSYGAFILRKNYSKNIIIAFIITSIAVTGFAMIPLTQALLKPAPKKRKIVAVAVVTKPEDIPQEKEEKVEEIEQPKIETQQATVYAPTDKEIVDPLGPLDPNKAFGQNDQEGEKDPFAMSDFLDDDGKGKPSFNKKHTGSQLPPRYLGKGTVEDYIAANVDPASLEKEGGIVVQYVVSAKGEISNVKIIRGLNPQLDNEVIRVVKTLKYKPALQNFNPVPFTVQVPLSFIFGE